MAKRPGKIKIKSESMVYESNIKGLDDELRKHLVACLRRAVLVWQASIRKTLAGQRSGKEYFVPKTRVKYTASAPGEAPAMPTGQLRASYTTEVDRAKLEAYLGSELDKALWMERGTRHIAPRPAIVPSFETAKGRIVSEMGRKMREAKGPRNG